MRRPCMVWGFGLSGWVAYDVWCAYNDVEGDSLSEVIRYVMRTDTPAGRGLFLTGWTALTVWVVPHICRKPAAA